MKDDKEMPGEESDELDENDGLQMDSENEDSHQGEVINDTESGNPNLHRRRSKKRIKTRIRVKKNSSSGKKYKKLVERLIWIAFIAAFVTTLVILYQQLGFNDSKYKSNKRTMLLTPYKQNLLIAGEQLNKHKSNTIVTCI